MRFHHPEEPQTIPEAHPLCRARATARRYLLLAIVLFWTCGIAAYCAMTGDRP